MYRHVVTAFLGQTFSFFLNANFRKTILRKRYSQPNPQHQQIQQGQGIVVVCMVVVVTALLVATVWRILHVVVRHHHRCLVSSFSLRARVNPSIMYIMSSNYGFIAFLITGSSATTSSISSVMEIIFSARYFWFCGLRDLAAFFRNFAFFSTRQFTVLYYGFSFSINFLFECVWDFNTQNSNPLETNGKLNMYLWKNNIVYNRHHDFHRLQSLESCNTIAIIYNHKLLI